MTIDDIETEGLREYKPSVQSQVPIDPKLRAKNLAAAAATKRWLLKRQNQEVEVDERSAQQMALDTLEGVCDSTGWTMAFDAELLTLSVRDGADKAFKAQVMPNDSNFSECWFVRNCPGMKYLQAAIEQGFDYVCDAAEEALIFTEDEIEEQYEFIIGQALEHEWDIQGDEKDPDKLSLGKSTQLVAIRWDEAGRLRATVGYRISSMMQMIDLIKQYTNNPKEINE